MQVKNHFPAFGINLFMLDSPRVGRRLALSGCMLIAGVVLVLSPLIPSDQVSFLQLLWCWWHFWWTQWCVWSQWKSLQGPWLVALSMFGKLAITSAYGTVYIFSTELFPTRWYNQWQWFEESFVALFCGNNSLFFLVQGPQSWVGSLFNGRQGRWEQNTPDQNMFVVLIIVIINSRSHPRSAGSSVWRVAKKKLTY